MRWRIALAPTHTHSGIHFLYFIWSIDANSYSHLIHLHNKRLLLSPILFWSFWLNSLLLRLRDAVLVWFVDVWLWISLNFFSSSHSVFHVEIQAQTPKETIWFAIIAEVNHMHMCRAFFSLDPAIACERECEWESNIAVEENFTTPNVWCYGSLGLLLIVASVQLNFPLFRSYIFLMGEDILSFSDSEDAAHAHRERIGNERAVKRKKTIREHGTSYICDTDSN